MPLTSSAGLSKSLFFAANELRQNRILWGERVSFALKAEVSILLVPAEEGSWPENVFCFLGPLSSALNTTDDTLSLPRLFCHHPGSCCCVFLFVCKLETPQPQRALSQNPSSLVVSTAWGGVFSRPGCSIVTCSSLCRQTRLDVLWNVLTCLGKA